VLQSTTEYPASTARSSTPRASAVKKLFSTSGMISAMTSEERRRRVRAVRLGRKSSWATAARTRSVFSGETALPLSTRETVAGDTPARAATS
jgi:hypothetical protein